MAGRSISEAGEEALHPDSAEASAHQPVRRVSYLDQTLWSKLNEATTPEAFCTFWLVLQCRMIAGVRQGVVLLGPPDSDDYRVIAGWPEGEFEVGVLDAVANRALAARHGVIQGHGRKVVTPEPTCFAAYPFVFDSVLHGVVALEVLDRPEEELRIVMQQLQWGASWVEFWHFRRAAESDRWLVDRATTTLELIAGAIEEEQFDAACLAAITEMATRFGCERVSLGLRERGHMRVMALSHTARLSKKMNLVRALGAAMDEAVDQQSAILYPNEDASRILVTSAHATLIRGHGTGSVLTVPFAAKDSWLGAIAFERRLGEPFNQQDVDLLECLASGIGPIIALKRRDDRLLIFKIAHSVRLQLVRLFGPRYYGRKLAAVFALVMVAFFAVATDEYRVRAPAELEGLVRRVVVAPFDGYVLDEQARAGDIVRAGQLLAALDDHDLALERLHWISTRAQKRAEHDQALAERKAAAVNIARAEIEQADAQIALLDAQLKRAQIRAPFDGVVVSGDLSQSVGASVERGKALFEIAPLKTYRLILNVDESDIADIRVGQHGKALMSSMPDEALPFEVMQITPVSEVREGRNYFRVEARLSQISDSLRPGMNGVAKIEVDERRLIWIWTHRLADWFRVKVWAWWP